MGVVWKVAVLSLFAAVVLVKETESLKISAFNVQVFGRTKAKKADVMEVLVKIIRRYDIILIQEIRDRKEEAIYDLLDQVNDAGDPQYELVISGRLGRTSSKEQYAYMYKAEAGIEVQQVYQYPDPDDKFQREPYTVKFSVGSLGIDNFALSGIHTDPDEAVEEIDQLDAVHEAIVEEMNTENVMILGDFNADCRYVTESEMPELVLRQDSKYHWLIPDSLDTTTSSTDCAYDRFVVSGESMYQLVVPGSANVFRYDLEYGLSTALTKAVSDHFPIEVELSDSATDGGTRENGISNLLKFLKNLLCS